jgi:cytochrome c oxidase subunit II
MIALAFAALPMPSALEPAGPAAARIETLYWIFFWISTAVYAVVLACLAAGLVLRRSGGPEKRTAALVVGSATVVTLGVLFAMLWMSLRTGRANREPLGKGELAVQVTGRQWWWEIRYPGNAPSEQVVTANEMHVPVGRPIHLQLTSGDVIHSFWVPALNGKTDLIPGRHAGQIFRVDRPGVFHGRCAEFCGYQHAHMGLLVIAEPPEKFEAWLSAQRNPAAEPDSTAASRGRQVFLGSTCVTCHTIRGTSAAGTNAPDLTHLASRRTIAAATLANNAGSLGGWIADSQGIKPGNHMPPSALPAQDLLALLAYLGGLK